MFEINASKEAIVIKGEGSTVQLLKLYSQVTQSVARAARHLGVPEEVAKHLTLSAAEIAFNPEAVKLKHSDLLVEEEPHAANRI